MAEQQPPLPKTVDDLYTSIEAVRKRMHIHEFTRISKLSAAALHISRPNLIKLVHFEDRTVYDTDDNVIRELAAFTLWSARSYALTADGSIARPAQESDPVNNDFDGLVTVNHAEFVELATTNPDLINSIQKSTDKMARTIHVHDEDGKWVERPVTRDRLRRRPR